MTARQLATLILEALEVGDIRYAEALAISALEDEPHRHQRTQPLPRMRNRRVARTARKPPPREAGSVTCSHPDCATGPCCYPGQHINGCHGKNTAATITNQAAPTDQPRHHEPSHPCQRPK